MDPIIENKKKMILLGLVVAWWLLFRIKKDYEPCSFAEVDVAGLVASREPALVRGARVAIEWRRRLAPPNGTLREARFQKTPVFVLRSGAASPALRRLEGAVDASEPALLEDVPVAAFEDPELEGYLYATFGLEEWMDDAAKLDARDVPGANETAVPMLWFSRRGVVAQTHYDASHNFFAHLFGTKKVSLWPPGTDLRFFPKLHGARRQSQVDATASPEAVQKAFDGYALPAPAFEYALTPGDVLYIPPFWAHRVEATSFALSLSVVSPSAEDFAAQRAVGIGAPLAKCAADDEQRVVGTQVFLVHVLSRLPEAAVASPRDAANRLLRGRYLRARQDDDAASSDDDDDDMCLARDPAKHDAARRKCLDPAAVVRAAAHVVAQVNALPTPIVRTFASDYIEDLASWAVGPARTPQFVRSCLDVDRIDTSPFVRPSIPDDPDPVKFLF